MPVVRHGEVFRMIDIHKLLDNISKEATKLEKHTNGGAGDLNSFINQWAGVVSFKAQELSQRIYAEGLDDKT